MACTCCPCKGEACRDVSMVLTPNSAAVVANPQGRTFNGLITRTHDGLVQNDIGNWRINSAGAAQNTEVTVRWSYNQNKNGVQSFSMWHGAGNVLNDFDGILSATLTVFDENNNILFSGPANTGNSGIQWTTTFPSPINGVRHFELSQISKGSGAPDIYIREVQMFSVNKERLLVLLCNGSASWFDVDGNEIDQSDVIECN